jgi:hypothetical protein
MEKSPATNSLQATLEKKCWFNNLGSELWIWLRYVLDPILVPISDTAQDYDKVLRINHLI